MDKFLFHHIPVGKKKKKKSKKNSRSYQIMKLQALKPKHTLWKINTAPFILIKSQTLLYLHRQNCVTLQASSASVGLNAEQTKHRKSSLELRLTLCVCTRSPTSIFKQLLKRVFVVPSHLNVCIGMSCVNKDGRMQFTNSFKALF